MKGLRCLRWTVPVVGLLLLVVGCGDGWQKSAGTPTTTTPAVTVTPSTDAQQAAQSTDAQGYEGAERGKPTSEQARAARGAGGAARRFLVGYLPYSYGQPGQIRAATPELAERLRAQRPRVPAAQRRSARPRVRGLDCLALDAGRVVCQVLVADGRARYRFPVTVQQRDGRWLVSEVA